MGAGVQLVLPLGQVGRWGGGGGGGGGGGAITAQVRIQTCNPKLRVFLTWPCPFLLISHPGSRQKSYKIQILTWLHTDAERWLSCLTLPCTVLNVVTVWRWVSNKSFLTQSTKSAYRLFLLSLFVTLYIFLHLTVMHSSTFEKGWVGMSACPLVVLACESLHVNDVCTVCIWRCEHARFCVEVFYAQCIYIFIHSFHAYSSLCRHPIHKDLPWCKFRNLLLQTQTDKTFSTKYSFAHHIFPFSPGLPLTGTI